MDEKSFIGVIRFPKSGSVSLTMMVRLAFESRSPAVRKVALG